MIELAFYFSYYSFLIFGAAFIFAIWLALICGVIEFLFMLIEKTNYKVKGE